MRRVLAALVLAGALAGAAGADVDVSRDPGVQAEVSVAVDPLVHSTLLAAANSVRPPVTLRRAGVAVYGSVDGGATWTRSRGPRPRGTCVLGDPVVGIDRRRQQYLAFLAVSPCTRFRRRSRLRVFVSRRGGPFGAWHTSSRSIAPLPAGAAVIDDKPALAVDSAADAAHPGRVYVAWSRGSSTGGDHEPLQIVLTWSDDGGRSWAPAVPVTRPGRLGVFVTLALGHHGEVYAAWESRRGLEAAVARDGRTFGAAQLVAGAPKGFARRSSAWCPPAQPDRCVTLNPSLVATRGGSVLVWAVKAGASRRVFAARFDARLRRVGVIRQVAPTATPSDQFMPAATADVATADVWVCFYDTAPAGARRRTVYSCVLSRNGGVTWSRRVRAASVPSDETASSAYDFEYGDYQGVAAADGVAVPVWTDGRDDGTRREEIYATRLYAADVPPTSSS